MPRGLMNKSPRSSLSLSLSVLCPLPAIARWLRTYSERWWERAHVYVGQRERDYTRRDHDDKKKNSSGNEEASGRELPYEIDTEIIQWTRSRVKSANCRARGAVIDRSRCLRARAYMYMYKCACVRESPRVRARAGNFSFMINGSFFRAQVFCTTRAHSVRFECMRVSLARAAAA